jgi:predicted deacetylase
MDDACPMMHKENWQRIEDLLDFFGIQPLVAVIPNNKDESLFYGYDENFWNETIPKWQKKNWHLALHGYEHLYHETDKKSIIPLKNKSEFTGDDYITQSNKLKKGIQLLNEYGINPVTFIAPGHSFDDITIKALANETSIQIVSDGFGFRTYKHKDLIWIPQQLWNVKVMPFGLWTICLHPNTMKEVDFRSIEIWLKKHHKKIVNVDDVIRKIVPKKSVVDSIFERLILLMRLVK